MTTDPPMMVLDWFTGTGSGSAAEVIEFVQRVMGEGAEVESEQGRWRFAKRVRVGGLVEVMSGPTQEGMPDWCINATGEACQWLGFHRVQALVARSERLTRVDAAWDGVPFTVAQAGEAFALGNVRTRAREGTAQGPLGGSGRNGHTVTIGSRDSGRQVCIYDRRGPVRIEYRARRAHAEALRGLLLAPLAEVGPSLLGTLRAYLEFVDAGSDTNASRRDLLPWWDAFVGGVEVVRVVVERVATSVQRRIRWLRESVAPTMAALVAAGLSLDELVMSGRVRWRPAHRALTMQAVQVGGWG